MKKLLATCIMGITMTAVTACSTTGTESMPNPVEDGVEPGDMQENGTGAIETRDIMNQFDQFIANNTGLIEIVKFVNENISSLNESDANSMVLKLEEKQKKILPAMEEKFYEGDMQERFHKEFGYEMDFNNPAEMKDVEVKNLLTDATAMGYKIETVEGMFFPVIDYQNYKEYSTYVSADLSDYIDIMSTESNKIPVKDAALVISWEEILNRASHLEEFRGKYPDSVKLDDMNNLYKSYISHLLFGANNTPLFEYDSQQLNKEAKESYTKFLQNHTEGDLVELLKQYLDIIQKNGNKLTPEVDEYRKSLAEEMELFHF